ncbi:MAG TPA: Stp1/IreP family PP2C-type Ser/Thr phosphatase [Actinomycetota bacterium]|nr:Stp1/IreP family PP2C-type Ser/Thr phosphatase [Actinomycetota bacterium]
MRFVVGARTDVGRVREGNEDSYMVHEALFAVADGMGGHQGGEVASKLALDTLLKATDGAALAQAVQDANRAVFERAGSDPALAGMGTTLTAFLADRDTLRLAHVGDSRAYLLRDGELQRITTDHTVVEGLVEKGELTPHEASIHPQRSILTRAIGVEGEVQVDQGSIDVLPGDRLLLCSDGLTGMVDDEHIHRILDERRDPQAAADALVEAANEAGGQDNVTAVVIDVLEPHAQAASTETPAAPAPRPTKRFAAREPGRRRWPWRLLAWVLVVLVVLGGGLFAVKRLFVDRQWFVGASGGNVALYRGIPAEPLGFDLATLVEETQIPADAATQLAEYRDLEEGVTADSEEEARSIIAQIQADVDAQQPPTPGTP